MPMLRHLSARGNAVFVQIENDRIQVEIGQPGLLHGFTQGNPCQIPVTIGMAARLHDGIHLWDANLKRVLATVQRIFNPRRIWLGGGHAQDLAERMALPSGVHVVSNDAGLWGGLWLWR